MNITKLENRCFSKNYSAEVLLVVMMLFAAMLLQTSIANAKPISELDEQLKQAILAENWEKVVSMLSDANEPNLPAVLRLVKGHACLATNRNNESLCLFLNTTLQEDLLEWQKWSQDFATTHPESPIAYYFKGDSAARVEWWDQAISDFNMALDVDPNHTLVLNARGVVYALTGKLGEAREDFDKAIQTSVFPLADVYANLGARFIQMKDGAEGAIRAFNEAIRISSDFALALHGRGNVEVILYRTKQAEEDFKKANLYGRCAKKLFRENGLNLASYIYGKKKDELLAMAPNEDFGMSLGKTFGEPIGSPGLNQFGDSLRGFEKWGGIPGMGQKTFNNIGRALDALPEAQRPQALEMYKDFLQDNQRLIPHAREGALDLKNNIEPKGFNGTAFGFGGGMSWKGGSHLNDDGQILLNHIPQAQKINPEGVLASCADAKWDKGDWPFFEYYGFLYRIKSKHIFSTAVGEEQNESVK